MTPADRVMRQQFSLLDHSVAWVEAVNVEIREALVVPFEWGTFLTQLQVLQR